MALYKTKFSNKLSFGPKKMMLELVRWKLKEDVEPVYSVDENYASRDNGGKRIVTVSLGENEIASAPNQEELFKKILLWVENPIRKKSIIR